MGRMRKFTLLAGPAEGSGHPAAGGWSSKGDRRRQLVELPGADNERRHLFGAGEGPAEAAAAAKQETDNDYPPFTQLALMSAKTAPLICSANWGQAVTTSASSGLGFMAPAA
jgi:hypothetical protein